ncbi:MAG: hypothetical protein OEX04_01705 [Acidimicrobiia bacterium]|nr:hypothetical protein [Acidimicrobiia bacterium]MDH4306170.1 hypothetical protein [Acidimicrobiia bacterium]MDH5292084.1 hypothetical protein [Acidimicrobiia bacterium]
MSGRLVLMGSGEIAPTMVATHRSGMAAAATQRVVILDSPFGFQENAGELTEKITAYFRTSLRADVEVASLRRSDVSPLERETALLKVRGARYVFAGPGSPSYALKVWQDAGVDVALAEVLAAGGTVTLASAAALTAGARTLPVYEIYKAGQDPFWLDGMDLTAQFGLSFTVVPHWDNSEGGTHDTSRCYVGERRLARLEHQLISGILGIDEHTAAILDFASGTLTVSGASTVTLRGAETRTLDAGATVGLGEVASLLAAARPAVDPAPDVTMADFDSALESRDVDAVLSAMLDAEENDDDRAALRTMIVALGEAARTGLVDPRDVVAGFVDLLLELRSSARRDRRFDESDLIRERLADLGIEVRDTGAGSEWELA